METTALVKSGQKKQPLKIVVVLLLIACLCLAVLCVIGFARPYGSYGYVPPSTSDAVHLIDEAAEAILQCNHQLPGMIMAAVNGHGLTHTAGYGLSKADDHSVKADEYSVFNIASITKSFTALLALKILNENGFTSSSKLKDVIGPGFKMENDYLTNEATVQDLLSHKLGIPTYTFLRMNKTFSRATLQSAYLYLHHIGEFRNSFIYSNIGYGLVARITEMVDKKNRSWETIIMEELFKPLDMNSTYLRSNQEETINVSTAYLVDKYSGKLRSVSPEFLAHWGKLGGSGSIMTTAIDMLKWLQFYINNGTIENYKDFIPSAVFQSAIKPSAVKNAWKSKVKLSSMTSMDCSTYAAGLYNCIYRGYKLLMHTGTTLGYCSIFAVIPKENVGVFFAFNGVDDYTQRYALIHYVLDILLEVEPSLNKNQLCVWTQPVKTSKSRFRNKQGSYYSTNSSLKAVSNTRNLSLNPVDKYTGTYYQPLFGYLTISFNQTAEHLQLTYGIYECLLEPSSRNDRFIGYGLNLTWFYTINVSFMMTQEPIILTIEGDSIDYLFRKM